MVNISDRTKKCYFEKINSMPPHAGTNLDYHIRKITIRFQREFDETWIKYENGKATFSRWDQALNKWMKSELI